MSVGSITDAAFDAQLDKRLDALIADGWAIWERFDRPVLATEFHPFVAADYDVVRAALLRLRAPGRRFLELGSATGVIAVAADLMGFDAFGIELDSSLVAIAREVAARHGSAARFVAGSFLPSGYRWRSRDGDPRRGTIGDGISAYGQLGHALDDFDIVFGYPWDGEAELMRDVMQQYGRPDALLLLYDTNRGVRRYRGGREVTPETRAER
jgi:hypothetical protein